MCRNKIQKFQEPLSTETEKISNLSESKKTGTAKCLKQNLLFVTCECGTDILIVPDLKAMDRAIEAHVGKHIKKEVSLKRPEEISSRISDLLCQLILKKISEQNIT